MRIGPVRSSHVLISSRRIQGVPSSLSKKLHAMTPIPLPANVPSLYSATHTAAMPMPVALVSHLSELEKLLEGKTYLCQRTWS